MEDKIDLTHMSKLLNDYNIKQCFNDAQKKIDELEDKVWGLESDLDDIQEDNETQYWELQHIINQMKKANIDEKFIEQLEAIKLKY